jgi:hypothetical protein
MNDKQPKTLLLANELETKGEALGCSFDRHSAELRRLHKANDELLGTLKHARDLVAEWGACASAYEKEKYGLELDLKQLDAAIQRAEKT